MRRQHPPLAKIGRRLHQPLTKVMLPDAVHQHPRRQRILLARHPPRKRQSQPRRRCLVPRPLGSQPRAPQHRRQPRRHLRPRLTRIPPHQQMRRRRLPQSLPRHERPLARKLLLIEPVQLVLQWLPRRIIRRRRNPLLQILPRRLDLRPPPRDFLRRFQRSQHVGIERPPRTLKRREVPEHRDQLVVVRLRERIELVVVTPRTPDRRSQERRRRRHDDIIEIVELGRPRVVRFIIPRPDPIKPRRNQRLLRVRRQLIPRQLLENEPVVRLVGVECLYHIIAIPPRIRDLVVPLVAARLRIPHDIQPIPAPPLPILGQRQQPVDQLRKRLGRRIGLKLGDRLRTWWQANQIKVGPPDQLPLRRLRIRLQPPLRQLRGNERIDRMRRAVTRHNRNRRPHHGTIRPIVPIGLGNLEHLANGRTGRPRRIRPR